MNRPGTFIVLDGPDGTGTTTHSRLLAERLEKEGHAILLTAEPTDGPIGKFIREQLINGALSGATLQLLFCADRAWHIETIIKPALQKGLIVVCDRYIPSTLIYGSYQGQPFSWLENLNYNFIQPDCLIFTLPSLKTSLERIDRRETKDMFENENAQKKIHQGYAELAKKDPAIYVVDTGGSKAGVAEKIWGIVQKIL